MAKSTDDLSLEVVQKLKIIDQLMPAIELVINKDISLEEFAKEVAPLAAMRMASLVLSTDSNIAFKASQEVLNRELGKPVERRAVLHGDVKDLNEKQLNNEILRMLRDSTELQSELRTLPAVKKRMPKAVTLEIPDDVKKL